MKRFQTAHADEYSGTPLSLHAIGSVLEISVTSPT